MSDKHKLFEVTKVWDSLSQNVDSLYKKKKKVFVLSEERNCYFRDVAEMTTC